MKHLLVSNLKELYSWFVRRLSKKNQSSEVKKQVCYLMSFPNNDQGLIDAIKNDYEIVVLYNKNCEKEARKLESKGIPCYGLSSIAGLVKGIEEVSSSRVIIADNYFAFLGDMTFKQTQTLFQLWHATGAIKQFGFEDKTANTRSIKDKNRFKRVYQSFDYVFVASDRMADVFKRSYGLTSEQMRYTGFPRTDHLVNQKKDTTEKNGRHIVYLPTYRERVPVASWMLDVDWLVEQLDETDRLQIKLHPHVNLMHKEDSKVEWVSSTESADDYIKQADVLITDYSSVAFDFTLANPDKQLIMFWPDEADYRQTTGIQVGIEHDFPQPVARTTKDVLEQLNQSEKSNNQQFNQLWNTYNDGNATNKVLSEIKEVMDGEK